MDVSGPLRVKQMLMDGAWVVKRNFLIVFMPVLKALLPSKPKRGKLQKKVTCLSLLKEIIHSPTLLLEGE